MVKLLRIDSRLLHGQVAVNWISNVGATSILIANDEIMDNEMGKMALKMAKPNGINLAIRSIEQGAQLLNDPRSRDISIFALVKTIEDAVRLTALTSEVKKVNIGGIKKKEGSKLIAAAVYVNGEDMENLKKLKTQVAEVEFRMVPADSPKKLVEVMKNY